MQKYTVIAYKIASSCYLPIKKRFRQWILMKYKCAKISMHFGELENLWLTLVTIS